MLRDGGLFQLPYRNHVARGECLVEWGPVVNPDVLDHDRLLASWNKFFAMPYLAHATFQISSLLMSDKSEEMQCFGGVYEYKHCSILLASTTRETGIE